MPIPTEPADQAQWGAPSSLSLSLWVTDLLGGVGSGSPSLCGASFQQQTRSPTEGDPHMLTALRAQNRLPRPDHSPIHSAGILELNN